MHNNNFEQEKAYYLQINNDLSEKNEELEAQREELQAAIEALIKNNDALNDALAELKERNFELDQLMYRTSHDLRSPVSSILGMVNIFDVNHDPTTQAEYVKHIKEKANQLDNTVQSLVEFVKATRESILFEKIHLQKLIEDAILNLSYLANFDKLKIKINDETQGVEFYSNKFRIEILIKCIVANAIHFQGVSGQNSLKIAFAYEDGFLALRFFDNGKGIPAEILDKVTDMFFRGSLDSKGAGMGLYIANKIVKILNGEMVIESKEGEWTNVMIKLPNQKPQ